MDSESKGKSDSSLSDKTIFVLSVVIPGSLSEPEYFENSVHSKKIMRILNMCKIQ